MYSDNNNGWFRTHLGFYRFSWSGLPEIRLADSMPFYIPVEDTFFIKII
jgi:hypothetical protein